MISRLHVLLSGVDLDRIGESNIWTNQQAGIRSERGYLGAISHIKHSQGASNGAILPYSTGSPCITANFPETSSIEPLQVVWASPNFPWSPSSRLPHLRHLRHRLSASDLASPAEIFALRCLLSSFGGKTYRKGVSR